MFVIVQCLDNIESRENSKEMRLREKMALTMKQAGVAITLTSVTDIMCFFSAAITILPVLQGPNSTRKSWARIDSSLIIWQLTGLVQQLVKIQPVPIK